MTKISFTKYVSINTQNEEYVGTEPWNASEVFDEDGVITDKTDVFALGCVVYEMLALEAPVSEYQMFMSHLYSVERCSQIIRADRKSQVRQCLGFYTADFWSSLAYESAEQKPKHCPN